MARSPADAALPGSGAWKRAQARAGAPSRARAAPSPICSARTEWLAAHPETETALQITRRKPPRRAGAPACAKLVLSPLDRFLGLLQRMSDLMNYETLALAPRERERTHRADGPEASASKHDGASEAAFQDRRKALRTKARRRSAATPAARMLGRRIRRCGQVILRAQVAPGPKRPRALARTRRNPVFSCRVWTLARRTGDEQPLHQPAPAACRSACR